MNTQETRTNAVAGELFPPDKPTETVKGTATDGEEERTTFETLAELRAACDAVGEYFPAPTEALLSRGETLFKRNVGKIREALDTSGVDADTVNVVIKDYAGVLAGIYSFNATPAQIQKALKGCKPYRAFNIDRYGLYMGLFVNYSRYLSLLGKYQDNVKHTGTTATEETRRDFMAGSYAAMDAKALTWLRDNGIIQPADFVGVEAADVAEFFGRLKVWASLGDYVTYVFIAKYALMGTPEEIASIAQPPIITQISVLDFAVRAADEQAAQVDGAAENFAALFSADEREEQERAARAAREQARIWRENSAPVALHETPNIICSRPVEIAPNGDLLARLPVQRYIDDFTTKQPQYGPITPMTVQKAFEGVNLLPCFLKPNLENGQYIYRTNITEFSEMCGYNDANQEQKRALLGALAMLNNLYVVVDRPYKVEKFTNAKGREVKKTVGGLTAVNVVNLREFGLQTGDMVINVTREAMTGKLTFMTPDNYKQLRAEAKGLSQSRFNYQLLTKGHKAEDDLIAEVFGYNEKLKLAADDAEVLAQTKRYIQNHRADDRKKIARWFETYAAKGIIKYKYTKPTAQKGGGTYRWERLDEVAGGQEQKP